MATAEHTSPLKSKQLSTSSSRTRNDSDSQWLLLPNNLELGARSKPSKKQRNKEKHRHFTKENLSSSSEVADGLSCKTRSFPNFPRVKCNTATWLKDQFMNDDKRIAYDSEEICSDSDAPQPHQQNVNFPANQSFPDVEHSQEHQMPTSRGIAENENIKSVKDELKKKETALVYDILSHIQEFISEAESSWQRLDLSDEPVIKDAFVKLKNAVKDVEGDRENKLMLHHAASENGFANGISPSSSTSRVSNSKENICVDSGILCNDDEQPKCNHLQGMKASEERDELSSDDCGIVDVEQRVAAVEWERRKLKNKLVELHEEKKMKDELLRELYFLKDAANTASGDSQLQKAKEKKKKKLGELQTPSQHLKGMSKAIPPEDNQNMVYEPSDVPTSQMTTRQPRSSSSVKRDNVRKEQNSAFPARRHYEAEGRANEDPDIPAVPNPPLSPALDNPEMQDKLRKLKVAQQHVKVIKDIVISILENRKSRNLIPLDLHLLTPSLQKVDQYLSLDESDEESNIDREYLSSAHLGNPEQAATNVKEVCTDGLKSTLLDVDSHKTEAPEQSVTGNLEAAVCKKEDLAKLQSQFQQLMQIFPSSDRKNDDPVRSSGEGAYTQKRNPSRNVVPEKVQKISSLRSVPHQDNLQLTRQNIVSMESQNQSSNSNLHVRDCNSVKKDNINNLSGKMGKLSIQNSVNSSYPDVLTGSNNNMDSMSIFSYELNQNHSLPNEIERKTIVDILKRDKKKQKQYDRNHDSKICCNSSVDSEPLEGSASALPADTSAVAAWGGSSTLENFEDEEPVESLEEQDDDEESTPICDKGSAAGHRSTSQYSGQFSNMQHYIDSVTNMAEKQQRNLHHPFYNATSQNQQSVHGSYQHSPKVIRSTQREVPASNSVSGLARDLQETCASGTADHCHQQLNSKFIQQLKNHIDQLNTLCQNQISQNRSQASTNCHHTQNYNNFANICTPMQQSAEISVPCNQELLLCLSQCYHALYMQQLEIQHLQRCIWHNIDSELIHPSNLNSRNNQEDLNFRPYNPPSWSNAFIPSNHFPPDQVSPLSSTAYFHLPIKPYSSHNSGSFPSNSGTQPARAVIHPTSQNNVAAPETLNNQVPPRTRANNFWDNFRSYSRQNLLSTANNSKRNENVSSLVAPQVRQVYPLVANESLNRMSDVSNTCCSSSFAEYNRSAPNQDMQDVMNIPKKPKTNTVTDAVIHDLYAFKKKDVKDLPTNANSPFRNPRPSRCYRQNMESSLVQPVTNTSSVNLIQLHPVQDNSKVGSFSSIRPTSVAQFTQPVPDTSTSGAASEISRALSGEHQSDFLIGLFHEAQGLKSDVLRQKALRVIRDLAMSERCDSNDVSQSKVQNDQSLPMSRVEAAVILNQSSNKQHAEAIIPLLEATDNEKATIQTSSDALSGNIQNLPTAAILPLSKHSTPRAVSTGAVRKKPKSLSTCFPDTVSNGPTSSHDSGGSTADSVDVQTALPPNKSIEDVPGFVTEKVLSDLVSMLPSLKRRLIRDGCSQTFWTFIHDCLIESLRTHLFFCNINLSRKSLLHLRQTVCLFLSLFSGIALSDFDSDFLKYMEEFVYENITCFVASGQFAPVPSSLDEENYSMELDSKNQDWCEKMHVEASDQMKELSIKMPIEESETFSAQYRATSQQNLLQSICSYDNFFPEPNVEPNCLGTSAEDVGCRCNPEAEIEPEVEIGTEADLAEADQSPGQQGTVTDGLAAGENWTPDQDTVLLNRNASITGALTVNNEESRDIENSSESAMGTQSFSETCVDQEAILDDVPTKLYPSEEELPQQLKDDQHVQLLSDDINTNAEFISENNGDGGLANIR